MGAVDVPALTLSLLAAAAVTAAVGFLADKRTNRDWLVTAGLALIVMAIGIANLMTESPRETHIAAPIVGALLGVFGATGLTHGTRRVRPWIRWPAVFLGTFVLLLGGLLFGASVLPRFLGG